jgi:16S rRNA (adenine1518-N6/adenine1519-N6)-dimethyltransferase
MGSKGGRGSDATPGPQRARDLSTQCGAGHPSLSPSPPSRASHRSPQAVLKEEGLRPKKGFGQNFLVSPATLASIAQACVLDSEIGRARVVEIGAGTGALSHALAARAATVVAIERDRDLIPLLRRELAGTSATVLEADAASADWEALLGPFDPRSPRILCGNLPYGLTGHLLRRTAAHATKLERAVFMIQDDVADRLLAPAGGSARGALSVFVQAAFHVRRVLRAPPGAFHPPPAVTSAVVELAALRPARAIETPAFQALVRSAFQARRKTLRNAWAGMATTRATLEYAAARACVSLDARGETLDVEGFRRMAEALEGL